MSKPGTGALFLFCYLDAVTVLAIGDWLSDVGPALLYGGPAAFAAGFFGPALYEWYVGGRVSPGSSGPERR